MNIADQNEIRIQDVFRVLYTQKFYILFFMVCFAVFGFMRAPEPKVKYKAETVVGLGIKKDNILVYRDQLVGIFLRNIIRKYKHEYAQMSFGPRKGRYFLVKMQHENAEHVKQVLEDFLHYIENEYRKREAYFLKRFRHVQEEGYSIHFETTPVTVSPYISGRHARMNGAIFGVLGGGVGFVFACFQGALMRSYRNFFLNRKNV